MRTLNKFFNDHSGFSLTGLLMALSIAGLVVLGGVQLMKNAGEVGKKTELQTSHQDVQKLVETHLFTQDGCKSLIGSAVGDKITITTKSGMKFKEGTEQGKISIKKIEYNAFLPADEFGLTGIAKIKVVTADRSGKTFPADIPVPVNLSETDHKIESCNLYQRRALQEIAESLCEKSFGTMSAGKDCEDVKMMVMGMMIKSVCEDVYGSGGTVQLSGLHCNFKRVHAKKKCTSGQVMRGFNAQGIPNCVSP